VFGFLRGGAQERTTGTVLTLTGRDPGGFAKFASEHAPLFAPPTIQREDSEKAS
jgi:hypothetical protein